MRAGAHDYFRKDQLARLGPAIEREVRGAHLRHTQGGVRQAVPGNAKHGYSVLPQDSEVLPLLADDMAAAFTDIGALREAIAHDHLLLHYQPLVPLQPDGVVRAEALVRWRHPHYVMVPPARFIPLAEYTGLINPLTQWVLNAALQQCQAWRAQHGEVRVSVNVSMHNLQDPHIISRIPALLATWQISPTQLTVEITESTLAAHPKQICAVLAHLRTLGIRIALDDFGTGYATLAALRDFPVDELKIDRSFVRGLQTNGRDAAIVRSIIELGHRLGVQVVAEGVEEAATYGLLAALGCDLVQGYYISRPVSAAGFSTWLQDSAWCAQAA